MAAEALATPYMREVIRSRDFGMVRPLSRFMNRSGNEGGWMEDEVLRYAKDGDMEMIRCLKEMIMCGDGRHENLYWYTHWTAAQYGHFKMVAYLLVWWWKDQPPHTRAITDGQHFVPKGVLFMVARLGKLAMLQWLKKHCPVVPSYFCLDCASVDGWTRVPADAAGAGHVNLVLWCLDNGWEYSESWMEAAAKEGRSDVVMALVERGFACGCMLKRLHRVMCRGLPSINSVEKLSPYACCTKNPGRWLAPVERLHRLKFK